MMIKKILLPLAFFLPLLLLMAEFAIQGIAPFGEKSLAILDAKEQYISFSVFLADILRSGDSFCYSWKLLLGGPIAGLLGYYLASPFELLFLLFPEEEYLAAYDIVIALKLALSGLTMALWLKEKKSIRPASLMFSTAYALSGFGIVFGWCIMWLDAVYMLPLIALGLERIADGKRPFLYLICLGTAIIMNYYTGYMLCIFSVLYYIYLRFSGNHAGRLIREDGIFCIGSLTAALLAACMLFPVVAAMQGSADLSFANAVREYTYPAIKRLYQCILPGLPAETVDRIILPTLLCVGVLWLGLLCLTFRACLKETIALHRRLFWILIFILAVELWHRFIDSAVISEEYGQDPSGTWGIYKLFFGEADIEEIYSGGPNVYVGPLLLLLSCLYFSLEGVRGKQKGAAAIFVLLYYLSFTLHFPNRVWHLLANNHMFGFRYSYSFSFFMVTLAEECWCKRETLKGEKILKTAAFLFAVGLLCCLARREKIASWGAVTADLLLLLAASGALILNSRDNHRFSAIACAMVQIFALLWTVVANYSLQAETALEHGEYLQIKNEADNRLQAVKDLDSGLYRVRDTKKWLNLNDPLQFGFLGTSCFSSSERAGTTSFMSHIGVPSMISRFSDGNRGLTRAGDTLLGVRYLFSPFADYQEAVPQVYRNPYALNLAFVAPENASVIEASGNAAETLNYIFDSFHCGPVYSALKPTEIQRGQDLTICRYDIPEEEYWYLQLDSLIPKKIEIVTDGEVRTLTRDSDEYAGNMLIPVGKLPTGTKLEIRAEDGEGPVSELKLYSENSTVLREICSKINRNPTEIEFLRDDHIRISAAVPAGENLLIVTIPAEKAWKVTVDGTETAAETAFGLFLAVPVSEGIHVVDLQYNPREIRMGLAVSCLTILGLAAYAVLEKTRVAKKDTAGKERVKNAADEG